jgi:gamma-glutamyltranspeptidase / glutathione hydrolase
VPFVSVAGPSSVVTDAAVAVGNDGGSVVDVALVAALTAMCTEPGMCGPGGGGFVAIDLPGTDPVVIDGYMAFPGDGFGGEARLREVTMAYGGGVTTMVDAGSVAVPGVFAALDEAWGRHGSVPWRRLMDAVADAVDGGFPLSAPCHRYLSEGAAPIYRSDPVASQALFVEGQPRPLGSTIEFPGLADTLRRIGEEGARTFYEGDLAREIVTDLADRGGQLTMADMSGYQAVVREPIHAEIAGWRLTLNPQPAIGGVTVARVLEACSGSTEPTRVAEALVDAFQSRGVAPLRSPSTISVAAADDRGGVVAASFSAGYGSGIIPAGTGMLMNNALGELELSDGRGVPGERMVSNMAPTVARRGTDAVGIGSPGADRITTAVATTLLRLASGDTLQQAVDFPRLHPEFGDFGVRVAAEPGQDLSGIGLPVRQFDEPHMYFGGVNGAGLLDDRLVAHADSRRTGSVAFTTP